jgi:uncharacterized protein
MTACRGAAKPAHPRRDRPKPSPPASHLATPERARKLKKEHFDYRTGILGSPAEIDAAEWNALLARQAQPTPFLRHEFLTALDATRCAAPDAGWAPQFVTLTDPQTGKLAAAAPVYLKGHSYGEYARLCRHQTVTD